MAEPAPAAGRVEKKASRFSWRLWSRIIHRDLGHLALGLTLVYALSGLAVNHILDWDPSFTSYEEPHEIGHALTGTDEAIGAEAMAALGVKGPARDVYRASADEVQVVLDKRTLHINPQTGHVLDEGQRPRFFLRAANWLHLSRGKKAWTVIADAYAVGLIVLALTGIVLNTGRKGLLGRGGLFILAGAAIPILYVELSGGPEAQSGKPSIEAPARDR